MEKCSIGILLGEKYHKKTYFSQKQGLVSVNTPTSEEIELLQLRVVEDKGKQENLYSVCIHHK